MESRQIVNNKNNLQQQQHFYQTNNLPSGFVGQQPQQQQQSETLQTFTNLGIFCPPNAHQQFSSMPSIPNGSIPPHLAASLAAGYGQRLMGGHIIQQQPQQQQSNGSTTIRNGHLASSSSNSHPTGPSSSITSSSINRSQRCGVCRGCQCKPCGQCTYCQDSPQFGGPGVKKQSCVERRCLRVLENRLQTFLFNNHFLINLMDKNRKNKRGKCQNRDSPTFKARVGCNACEDCRGPDCRICLVCLDKRFFNSKYMAGALCAKKRCNNATALELPISIEHQQRSSLKRSSDGANTGNFSGHQHTPKRQVLLPPNNNNNSNGTQNQLNSNIARILSAAGASEIQQCNQKFNNTNNNYGRSSVGNSTFQNGKNDKLSKKFISLPRNSNNSPLSDNGSNSTTIQTTQPSLLSNQQQLGGRQFWPSNNHPSLQQQQQILGGIPPSGGGGHYHFDPMNSLAAVATFPQQQAQQYLNPYQQKFICPKYECFSPEETIITTLMYSKANLMSNGSSDQMRGIVIVGNNQQQQQNTQIIGGGGGTEMQVTSSENLLVPPSYSDKLNVA
ncbi:hypothetical protein Mgra_00003640 [Meloidogyne graminicola]|uniref:CXXC-type domain-containing protein n=1 Tax=Meloidogyne graminicola TaxID=189291 RepID=A0A8S9ZUG6_9BILA|nr:hypothetical protein Mgra_00003640 [Meloidogyne graminicola]